METLFKLRCIECGKVFPAEIYYRKCPICSGVLNVVYDYETLKDKREDLIREHEYSIWRYRVLLPIRDDAKIVTLKEGWTPLISADRLAKTLGINSLLLKDETRNPSGSFLDRGVSIDVSKALEYGYKSLTCGSTGNLAASVAAYAARSGLRAYIFVPKKIDIGKLYQIAIYGAEIYIVSSYEEALRRSEMMFLESYVVSTSDPWYLEGIKTSGYEVLEQLNFDPPDYVITAAGNGAHLTMVYKAFKEMHKLGFIDDVNTKFVAVQPEAADPIVQAFRGNLDHVEPTPVKKGTIATDIAVGNPVHGNEVLRILRKTGGTALSVSDNEILESLSLLARTEGILAEPSAAASLAGLKRLINEGFILPSERVVLFITGAGLKHPKAIRDTVSKVETLKKILSMVEDYRDLSRLGITKIRILQAISEGYTYGYAVWKALKEKFNIKIGLPTLYQHLKELEKMGLITVFSEETTGGRKSIHYTLTRRGKKIVEDFA